LEQAPQDGGPVLLYTPVRVTPVDNGKVQAHCELKSFISNTYKKRTGPFPEPFLRALHG